ncbi:MAG: hypothetical protein JNK77_02825 [Saprospiraceae bacterium]|nr:hypothetical protein [Saprospiraceae bacterium]
MKLPPDLCTACPGAVSTPLNHRQRSHHKTGYELGNKKEIEQVKLSSDERLGVDVILAPARREYYDISDKALLAGFEREKKALRDKDREYLI